MSGPRMAVTALADRLRSSLWLIPGAFAVGATIAAFVFVALDRLVDESIGSTFGSLLFSGGPGSARLVLSTIAAAMMSFTGLVFSVTMLVLQLASSQLSPRVMRTFLRDRFNQGVLGLFVATLLYALLVLREVRSPTDGAPFVPAISVTVSYLLLIASVGFFIVYIHHMAQAIRAITVLRSVGDETRAAIERLYPDPVRDDPHDEARSTIPPDRLPDLVVTLEDRSPGVVTSIDEPKLAEIARAEGAVIHVVPTVGDFVPTNAPLLRAWLRAGAAEAGAFPGAAEAIGIGPERSMAQDVGFGLRQLVDIAARALSPGTNDPSTAVQALDQLHDLLRRLAVRDLDAPAGVAEEGTHLVWVPRPSWADYVALALDEIRQYGSGSIQVARRLRHLLLDLTAVAPPARQEPIARQLRLLDLGLEAGFALADDRRAAALPSSSGQGSLTDPSPPR